MSSVEFHWFVLRKPSIDSFWPCYLAMQMWFCVHACTTGYSLFSSLLNIQSCLTSITGEFTEQPFQCISEQSTCLTHKPATIHHKHSNIVTVIIFRAKMPHFYANEICSQKLPLPPINVIVVLHPACGTQSFIYKSISSNS